ncbi:MAG: hypothetical protein RID91_16045 [Azospirillaceae bacterium]
MRLSAETLKKQLSKHKNIKPEDYRFVQDVLDSGDFFIEAHRPNTAVFVHWDGDESLPLKLAIKRTRSGDRLYITSFHRLTRTAARRLLRKRDREKTKERV